VTAKKIGVFITHVVKVVRYILFDFNFAVYGHSFRHYHNCYIIVCLTISSLSYTKKNRKGSSRKGKKLKMTWQEKSDRAFKAARTRAKNREMEADVRGESKKILLLLDGSLLEAFQKSRKKAHDMTLTAGIRRAMQDYIDKHPS